MRRGTSALPLPRFIIPASIEIGDTVRVAWEVGDITHTRTAKIVSREYESAMRVFYSGSGAEIFRWHPAHNEFKVTLLDKHSPETQEMLELFQVTEVV